MFKILISEAISSKITEEFIINKIAKYQYTWEVSSALDSIISLNEIFGQLNSNLSINPYQYPEIEKGVRLIIETYLPYFLFYKIKDDCVFIFDIKDKMELF